MTPGLLTPVPVPAHVQLHVLILTGLSGAGHTTALKWFEDQGYHTIEHLPLALLRTLPDTLNESEPAAVPAVVVGLDSHASTHPDFPRAVERLRHDGYTVTVLFLDAHDPVLIQRYSESRRPHPWNPSIPLRDAIQAERQALGPVHQFADQILDTSPMTAAGFRARLTRHYAAPHAPPRLLVTLLSFGYKYGMPYDADLVFDTRVLRNPFHIPSMKHHTGHDPDVAAYVLDDPAAATLLPSLTSLLLTMLTLAQHDERRYLTIAIGCTGGQHRSVAVTHHLAAQLQAAGWSVLVRHRDIDKHPRL